MGSKFPTTDNSCKKKDTQPNQSEPRKSYEINVGYLQTCSSAESGESQYDRATIQAVNLDWYDAYAVDSTLPGSFQFYVLFLIRLDLGLDIQ